MDVLKGSFHLCLRVNILELDLFDHKGVVGDYGVFNSVEPALDWLFVGAKVLNKARFTSIDCFRLQFIIYSVMSMSKMLGVMESTDLLAYRSSSLKGLALCTLSYTYAICGATRCRRSSIAFGPGSWLTGTPCSEIRRSGILLSSRGGTLL